MTTIAQDLGGVVRLLEEMTPGDLVVYDANEGDGWPPRPLWCFKNEGYDSGDDPALQGSIHYGGKEDAEAIAAAVNFLRTHSSEIAGALRDAERLDYIERTFTGMSNGERYLPRVMGWGKSRNGRTLREACDKYMQRESAMQQGGGGGDHA